MPKEEIVHLLSRAIQWIPHLKTKREQKKE
jgi:hypothetical protein